MFTFENAIELYRSFQERGYDLDIAPYQIRNADMSAGAWKAKVNVLRHSYRETVVVPIWGSKKYDGKAEAQWAALLLGLEWLQGRAG